MGNNDMHRLEELTEYLNDPRITPGLIADAIKEVAGGYTTNDQAEELDPLADYRPWLREGQVWETTNGKIGRIHNAWGKAWFQDSRDMVSIEKVGGRPIGTVWDLLPSSVETLFVVGNHVKRWRESGQWAVMLCSPRIYTILSDGWHDRPVWAQ